MTVDARLAVAMPSHPKTKKLIKRLGQAAAWNLVCLILWSASNRSDGDLVGLSVEDIELASDWMGEDGVFVAALIEVRFLDEHNGGYLLHDWHEHNPWAAGADMRSSKARWNAIKKHHGAPEADRQVPEYAAARTATSMPAENQQQTAPTPEKVLPASCVSASSMLAAEHQHDGVCAPSLTPYPSLTPIVLTPAGVNARIRAFPQPDGVPDTVWQDFKKLRSTKKAPITETALAGIAREAGKAGLSLADALATCCQRGWTGFEAAWLARDAPRPAARDSPPPESFAERDERRANERYREAIGQSSPPKTMGEVIDISPQRLTQ